MTIFIKGYILLRCRDLTLYQSSDFVLRKLPSMITEPKYEFVDN